MFNQQEINLSTLILAIQNRNVQVAKFILKNNDEILNYKNQLGETLIHVAVKNNFQELISWLVYRGLHIDSVDSSNRTALHLAVAIKNEGMIEYLLKYGASTNLKDFYGKSPFHMVIQFGNTKLVNLFLENGASVLDVTSNTHETAFHIALKNEDVEIFQLLSKNYFGNFNVSNIYGETLLHILARQRNENLTRLLLEKGTNLEMINKDNETALHFAVHNRNFNICKLFIEYGANVNAKNKYGESPLYLAIRYKDAKLVNLLLRNNANVNDHTNDYDTVLHIAINYFNEDITNLLLEYGVNVENKNSCDLNPFHLAIKNKCIDGARILLNKGADVNCKAFGKFNSNQHKGNNVYQMFTPLHTAIIQKDFDAVKFLLENGAKLDFKNNYEIFLAVETGCAKIVEQLIKYGADVNAINNTGQSLLYTAMKVRNKEEVQMLLNYGADSKNINEIDNENETALHLAVKAKDEKFVQFLLNIGIDINIANINNSTALSFAHGCTNIANILISKIALLKINNSYVCKFNENVIDMVQEFKLYFLRCTEELLKIQMESFNNISLINFLRNDEFILAKLVRRKTVVIDFNASVNSNKYPIYYQKLKENIDIGIEKWNLIKKVTNILNILPCFEPLYDVLDEIVDNFSTKELNSFLENSNAFE